MKTGEYSDKTDRSWHACSASELPTVKDLRWQTDFLDSTESAFGVPDCSRRAKEIERQLNGLISVVDGFYSLLGERGWVFCEALSVDRMRLLVEESADICPLSSIFCGAWCQRMAGHVPKGERLA